MVYWDAMNVHGKMDWGNYHGNIWLTMLHVGNTYIHIYKTQGMDIMTSHVHGV